MSEWQTISKGKKGKRSGATYAPPAVNSELLRRGRAAAVLLTSEKSSEAVVADVRRCQAALRGSAYFAFVREQLRGQCGDGFGCVLGLGIGSLSSDTSVLQLALYLLLCEAFLQGYNGAAEALHDPSSLATVLATSDGKQVPPVPSVPPAPPVPSASVPTVSSASPAPSAPCMGVFDPLMSTADEAAYRELRVPVLRDNLRGKHVAHAHQGRTLFFLPHCPHRLYCNLLWANWGTLDRLVIFGNSFHSYSLRRLNDPTRRAPAPHKGNGEKDTYTTDPTDTMALLLPCVTEVDLWPSALVRSSFLREGRGLHALRCLENAVCDLGLMLFKPEGPSLPGLIPFSLDPQLAARRPSGQQIDAAAAADPELF